MTLARVFAVPLALMTMPFAVPSYAWNAINSHTVNPLSDTSYEVIGRGGISSNDYWCAAGDFAFRVLGAGSGQRIYVSRERGSAETENAKSAVQFSLEQPDVPSKPTLLLTVTRIGDSLSIASARGYCISQRGRAGG